MEYLFEDDRDKGLPKLFRKAYPDNIIEHFHYSYGSGNLESEAIKILKNSNNRLLIIMDLVVNNPNTWRTFDGLASNVSGSSLWKGRVILLPIPCIEYYFIHSLHGSSMEIYPESVEKCISIEPYLDDELIKKLGAEKKCRTHEKYCKFIVDYAFRGCTRSKLVLNGKTHKEIYQTTKCMCGTQLENNGCVEKSLTSKSLEMLRHYRLVPKGTLEEQEHKREITFEEAKEISLELVKKFNNIVQHYIDAGELPKTSDKLEIKY